MADIELVVKIPEEIYKASQIIDVKHEDVIQIPLEVIANGIPLPKGHGRLIDADAFKKNVCTYQQTGCGDCKHSLCCPEDAPTIIEAIPKDQYEARLKADMMAMLEEINTELDELGDCTKNYDEGIITCQAVIQEKIDKLKEGLK